MKILKTIMTYKDTFFIAIFVVLVGTNFVLKHQNNELELSVEQHYNNELAYQNIANNTVKENNVLRLSALDMQNSYDSTVVKMNKTMDSLHIARKQLKFAASIAQKIDTTIVSPIEYKDTTSCDFTKILVPNELTTITVKSARDTLSINLQLYNEQLLYVYNKKIYRNANKKFFKRLVTFDWRKVNTVRYNIINTNDLILVTDTRVIEITENE